ncbi:MaoC/PaaZ C-terminal domain-containing protein [Aminobacter carboxidus]|uniref:MaoC family dehydratase N-terminal domain-containing protein n=1 Tax=Aminobacter carboxidus TaxID=376165 RepID=A0ABR9GQL0_9HYPH|nr:MaoC family dehydratase N-terminal domain-containing protein [Aminobacter carboxidus]
MSIPAASILDFAIPKTRQTVSAKDAILYAMSVGYGTQPLDTAHLRYVYEADLLTAPTLANVVAHAGPWMKQVGVDWSQVVHAEHRLTVHRPMPLDASMVSSARSLSVIDRGVGKGMFAAFERVVSLAGTDEPVATIVQTNACRGDGGCGSAGRPPEPLPPVPNKQPDASHQLRIAEDAALLYRLNGDQNPLHVDPSAAKSGGFTRPILHGLCTFGHAGYVISRMTAGSELAALGMIAARFTAPAFPGDTLQFQMWRTGLDIRFRCVAPSRGTTILDNGVARLA